MPSATRLYTVDDVRAMPDDGSRYETIAGELFVTPAPGRSHQAVIGELYLVLAQYVKRHGLGRVWLAPFDVVFGPMTLVEPDLFFVRASRAAIVTEREVTAAPDLAIEVVSPTTGRTDRGRKRALYQDQGVTEYWVVDPRLRRIELWRPGAVAAEVVSDALRWQPDPTVEPLRLDVEELFRESEKP